MVAIRIFLFCFSFICTHSRVHANKTHHECHMGSARQINKWHKLKWCHSKQTDFKLSTSCWETNLHWAILIFGWSKLDKKRFVSTLCGELYFCRVSFLWASSKRVFVSRESNEQSQRTCMTLFNFHHHHTAAWVPIRQGQQFNLAWETFILWPFSFVFLKCFDDRS
jgi:hypothetical protein